MPDRLSQGDLATLSLLDPEQGVCPDGHRCRLDREPGLRNCETCDYRGLALLCWDVKPAEIDSAEQSGARSSVIAWARSFVAERS